MLMHKNKVVADLLINQGVIEKIHHVYELDRLPIGTIGKSSSEKGKPSRKLLDTWWASRGIPTTRARIKNILQDINMPSTHALAANAFGLSLSDHYWIHPKGVPVNWEEINFFTNDFSADIGDILFGADAKNMANINFNSPDSTTDGWLKKRWIISNNKRLLLKGGSNEWLQEPINEVIASALLKRLNIDHIPYTLTFENGVPYSLCETFVTTETELIPGWYVQEILQKNNQHSPLTHLLHCCDYLGIKNAKDGINKMLTLDYIIRNTDRHYNNFGFLRNPETLEWIGFSPIYDSGTSLWHDTSFVGRTKPPGKERESMPFKKTHTEQFALVDDLSWFDPGALSGFEEECMEIFAQSEYVSKERAEEITEQILVRIEKVKRQKSL